MSLYAKAQDKRPLGVAPKNDNLANFGGRMLLRHMISSGGLAEQLPASVQFVGELVTEFTAYVAEGDEMATPAEFIRRMATGLANIKPLAEETRQIWERWMNDPRCQGPFKPHMAANLSPTAKFNFEAP